MGTDLAAGARVRDGPSVTSVESMQGRVEAVSLEALVPIVRRALADDHLTVLDREVSQLQGAGNPTTRGLFRISGTARGTSGEVVPWQLVLKVVGDADLIETGYCHEPTDWNYWKREALAFRSGLLDGWPGPLWPVRAYAVEDVTADEVWVWLQVCGDAQAKKNWSLDRLASAAHDLGAFAAQWAAAPPNPDLHPWLAQRWVDGWVATARSLGADHAAGHDGCWTTGLLRGIVSTSTPGRVADPYGDSGHPAGPAGRSASHTRPSRCPMVERILGGGIGASSWNRADRLELPRSCASRHRPRHICRLERFQRSCRPASRCRP